MSHGNTNPKLKKKTCITRVIHVSWNTMKVGTIFSLLVHILAYSGDTVKGAKFAQRAKFAQSVCMSNQSLILMT